MPNNTEGNAEGCIFNMDPQLGQDYAIPLNSPCVNMGIADTTGLGIGLTDYLNQSRMVGGRIDIGAAECQSTGHIVLTSPNGREGWSGGSTRDIKWRGNAANVKLDFSSDNGSSWSTIVASTPNDSTHQWQLPAVESQQCRVKASDVSNPLIADVSDTTFTIFTSTIPDSTILTGRLTIDNSPYTLNGLIIVPQGDSLIIDPGVVLQFKTEEDVSFGTGTMDVGGLYVKGKLIAEGTASQRITFTRQGSEGNWGCIAFHPGSDNSSVFSFCNVEYANRMESIDGYSYLGAMSPRANGLSFSQCNISNNLYFGVYTYEASTDILNCVIANNSQAGIYVRYLGCNIFNCTITGNKGNGGIYDNRAQSVITNCIFWGNSKSFTSYSYSYPTVTYCLIQEGIMPDDANGNGEGCIFNMDPQLGQNYNLLASSPLINIGKPDTTGMGIGNIDYFGNTRIYNDTIDIGATEYQSNLRLKLNSMNGGDKLVSGNNYNITWESNTSNVKLEYSTNNGSSWNTIVGSIINSGQANWQAPSLISYECLLKISDASNSGIYDISDSPFSIFKNETEANLAYYWNFDNYSTKEILNTGNNGTLRSDAFYGNGLKLNSLLLDGDGDYVHSENKISPPQEFSIALWFKTDDAGNLVGFSPEKTSQYSNEDKDLYIDDNGLLYFGVNSTEKYTIHSTTAVNDNQWHFAVATFKSTNMSLYIDGAKVANFDSTLTANENTGYWRLGYSYLNNWESEPESEYFDGELDEVKIYNLALTEQEVQKMGVLVCPKYHFKYVSESQTSSADSLLVINKSSTDIVINQLTSSNPNIILNLPQPASCLADSSTIIPATLEYTTGLDSSAIRMDYSSESTTDFDNGKIYVTQFKDDNSELAIYAERAITYYDSCYVVNPNSNATANNLGLIYRLADDPERALTILSYAFKKAQDNKTSFTNIKMNIGVVQSDLEDSQEAYDYYEGTFSDVEDDSLTSVIAPQIYYNQAWEHYVNDSVANVRIKAWATINHEKSNDYLIAKAYALLGVAEAGENDTTIAINYLLQAIQFDINGPIGVLARENIDILRMGEPEIIYGDEYVSICEGENYLGWISTGDYERKLVASSGADSIVTTFLTVNPTYDVSEQITICEGASHKGWTETNTYVENLKSGTDCDSIITTNLVVLENYRNTVYVSICQGDSHKGYTESTQFTKTFKAVNSCDSIETTILTVNPTYDIVEDVTICEGASHKGWTETNTYVENLKSGTDCDSIITTNLVVLENYRNTVYVSICQGDSYKGYSESIQFTETFSAINSCDSIVTTILTVNPIYNKVEDVTICEGNSHKGWIETNTYVENLESITGCDSIVTTNLVVGEAYQNTVHISICQGDSHKGYSESTQFTETFSAINSCDSIVTTILTVNPTYNKVEDVTICAGASHKGWTETNTYIENLVSATGCDSIVTTNLVVGEAYQHTVHVSICQGDLYKGYSESTQFTETFQAVLGCDSIVTSILTVNSIYNEVEDVTICEGASHKGWTETNTYVENLKSVADCDSIVTTNLVVGEAYQNTVHISICQGDSHKGYSESTQFTETFSAINSCDSIVTTTLTVNPTYNKVEDVTICEGASHKGWTETNTYIENLKSGTDCDSIITTNLVVLENYRNTVYVSICQGDLYKGYSESTQFTETFQAVLGCDSTVTSILTVNSIYNEVEDITICEGNSHKGWTKTNTYVENLESVTGCDSIVTTNLVVLKTTNMIEEKYICEDESYNGLSTSGKHIRKLTSLQGCDSLITTYLFVNPLPVKPTITQNADSLLCNGSGEYTWFQNNEVLEGVTQQVNKVTGTGFYQVAVTSSAGCQSPRSDSLYVVKTSTNDVEFARNLKVYPNPTSGIVNLQGLDVNQNSMIRISDNTGRVIYSKKVSDSFVEINLSGFASGIYHLMVIQGNRSADYKVVKK